MVRGRGVDGAEEGEGMWVLVAEFQGENERDMTVSNGMETMMMEKTENYVDIVHVPRIGISSS
jgi:hypothetical protein